MNLRMNPAQPELNPVLFNVQYAAMDKARTLVASGYLDRAYVWKIREGDYAGLWCVLRDVPRPVLAARLQVLGVPLSNYPDHPLGA